MTSFLPSSIQKRLLRYALLRTGLLDTQELDLDSLDINLGRQNTVELRNVGLHVQKLSSLLELPPEVKLETARVVRLKLNVPADLYYGSITAEADGIECVLALEPAVSKNESDDGKIRNPDSTKAPQHRKTFRRMGRSHLYGTGDQDEEDLVPTTQDLARSFLLEEPHEEVEELEQRYRSRTGQVAESVTSEASDDEGLGTGAAPGLPGFLAGFLQVIMDRFQLNISGVVARINMPMQQISTQNKEMDSRLAVIATVEDIQISPADKGNEGRGTRRKLACKNIKVVLEGLNPPRTTAWASPATPRPDLVRGSRTDARQAEQLSPHSLVITDNILSRPELQVDTSSVRGVHPSVDQAIHRSTKIFQTAQDGPQPDTDPYDILLGDDNLAWNLRRTETGSSSSDIWSEADKATDLEASVSADQYLSGASAKTLRTQDDHESPSISRAPTSGAAVGDRSPIHVPVLMAESTSSADLPTASALLTKSGNLPTDLDDSVPERAEVEDLTESRMYTEEEAQSLYMSAYSTEFPGVMSKVDADAGIGIRSREDYEPGSSTDSTDTLPANVPVDGRAIETDMAHSVMLEDRSSISDNSGHQQSGVAMSKSTTGETPQGQRILQIDYIDVIITSDFDVAPEDNNRPGVSSAPGQVEPPIRTQHMPGSFSVYADQSASVRFEDPASRSTMFPSAAEKAKRPSSAIEICVGEISVAIELTMLDEYLRIGKFLTAPMRSSAESRSDQSTKSGMAHPAKSPLVPMTILVNSFRFDLVESADRHWTGLHVASQRSTSSSESISRSLVSLQIVHISALVSPVDVSVDWSLDIRSVHLFVGDQKVLSFADRLQESRRSLIKANTDISVDCSSATTISKTKVTTYSIQTRQLNVSFDLVKFGDTFTSYGGISGLIEIGSSFVVPEQPSRSPTSARKGVRFEDNIPRPAKDTEVKINARFEGLDVTVSGRAGAVRLLTSSVKTIARSELIVASIDNVQVVGPHVPGARDIKPTEIVANSFRFEYHFRPTDADLERLLSLLTPSKNKYESDDDILLDTLLRQRRKGAVARLQFGCLQVRIQDRDFVTPLQAFADEMASLSAVAKYLPEDDRPGLLTHISIQEFQAIAPVNTTFGNAVVLIRDCNIAHIGLPSLLAFALGTASIQRQGSFKILHGLLPLSPNEDLPMVMARMIGDEVEPTLRLKLFNVCVEYSVPMFLALTEFGVDVKADQVIDMAASVVADLTAAAADLTLSPTSTTSLSGKPSKKLSLDLLFHQCMIGLQPTALESKALVVLDNAKITTSVPPKETIQVSCELRKAGIFIANRVTEDGQLQDTIRTSLSQRILISLRNRGYVSACSLMTARIDIAISGLESEQKSVVADVKNELLLLETCADSTRTLIQTLGALAPPSPPSKDPKYRTEAISMDEMVSSFTGDAFEKPSSPPSTIFDTDTAMPPDDDDLLDASMTESMYGGLGDLEDPESDMLFEGSVPMETAESLLEEDPFEFPDNPNTAKLSDKDLIKDLDSQHPGPKDPNSNVTLRPWFTAHDQFNRLPGESNVLGAAHRFNTPLTKQREISPQQSQGPLPFNLRIREVHIIWNLYDGYDWQTTRQAISQAVEEVEIRAEERRVKRQSAPDPDDEESIIGDCLFNSIYIGVPASKDAQDLRRQINRGIDDLASETESYATSGLTKPTNLSGGSSQRSRRQPRRLKLERSRAHKVAFELKGVSADILVFQPGSGEVQNSTDVRVRDFEIFDNLPTSTWRKFMTSWQKDGSDRELAKPMLHLEISSIRPILELSAVELLLRVTITPLRLHVDQDALDFITRFFQFKDSAEDDLPTSEPPFVQRLEIYTVDLCLDYKPKRVDYAGLRSGRYTEFKNFFILDSAHIKLKHVILYGLTGFETLNDTLSDIWTPDIKRNQLPSVLTGLSGVSPLVSLGTGIADVVAVPIREYRKDGRIVRSIQKGAMHLARNTTSEVARFGARVAVGTHNALLGAEGLFTGPVAPRRRNSSADVDDEDYEDIPPAVSAYANQPLGVMAGLRSARRALERDLLTARDAAIAVQGELLDGGSPAAAIARHAPTIILRPVIGATRAVGQTLMGVGNQVDRSNVKRIEDKYKQR